MSSGSRGVGLRRWTRSGQAEDADVVVEECAIALSYNGLTHAVMMATPTDLEDFAFGFSLHEGIVESVDELHFIECTERDAGRVLELAIPQARFEALRTHRRSLVGNSSCGLCGSEALQSVNRPLPRVCASPIDFEAVNLVLHRFSDLQQLNRLTGGAHAAAWCVGSDIRLMREDVGRHNALDKLGGAMLRAGAQNRDGYVVVSSRASFELVQKTARLGLGSLVAMSAPTSAAIEGARRCGLRLIGFARDGAMNVYTEPDPVEHMR